MRTSLDNGQATTLKRQRYRTGTVISSKGVQFTVWAPQRRSVSVVIGSEADKLNDAFPLNRDDAGYFSGTVADAQPEMLYGFRLDDDPRAYPDPMSRFQPEGPHGPSQIIDPAVFDWTDSEWKGLSVKGQVIYEMHVGTFTTEGTWEAAEQQLPELADIGITVLEVMPVNEFPGRFGWGYDGVNLFAPTRLYGSPDDFRSFIDRAHALGIAVILDVVYNHIGPDGNYLSQFSPDYFSQRYKTDWGPAINFDGENSEPVREYFVNNVDYWISEFHLDGLRFDATQDIHDASSEHILAVMARRARKAAGKRSVILVAENEPQRIQLARSVEQGGYGLDCMWNDDFHHSAMVALTSHNEAYYTDYLGRPQEFISAAKYGFLYQGQWYNWQKNRRGTSTRGSTPDQFINFVQNHDQVANSGRGLRCNCLTSPGRFKALTSLLLLMPGTPMLFQGQEFGASSPFFFFADHNNELAKKVHEGRKQFMAQFRSVARPEVQAQLHDPADPMTFIRSKLKFDERQQHKEIYQLHRDLLALRREGPMSRAQQKGAVDGAVLSDEAFVLRYFAEDDEAFSTDERLLFVNLGRDLHFSPAPEPLLAPPPGCQWKIYWSTEDPIYGGCGTAPLDTSENWRIPGESAVVLAPEPLPLEDEPTEDSERAESETKLGGAGANGQHRDRGHNGEPSRAQSTKSNPPPNRTKRGSYKRRP
jgi:maltooligosyltrehalose trehalohydrolase